jgi:hypothetical protein
MMALKDNFIAIVSFRFGKPKKWENVKKIESFLKLIEKKFIGWKYIQVYRSKGKEYLTTFYNKQYHKYFNNKRKIT